MHGAEYSSTTTAVQRSSTVLLVFFPGCVCFINTSGRIARGWDWGIGVAAREATWQGFFNQQIALNRLERQLPHGWQTGLIGRGPEYS